MQYCTKKYKTIFSYIIEKTLGTFILTLLGLRRYMKNKQIEQQAIIMLIRVVRLVHLHKPCYACLYHTNGWLFLFKQKINRIFHNSVVLVH